MLHRFQRSSRNTIDGKQASKLVMVKKSNCIILQAESELRERICNSGMNEHEVQMKALQYQHEDECKQLQEELDLQRSKEERQRALLQLQWKVVSDNPQDEQEVNSKKVRSSI